MKKLLSSMLAILLAGSLAACSSSTPSTSSGQQASTPASAAESSKAEVPAGNGEKLVFWTLQQSDSDVQGAQEKAVAAFEEENGCTVEVTALPYTELRDKLLAALAGGQGPDILMMDQIWTGQYAAAGFVEPIDDRIASSNIKHDDFFEGAWGASSYLGKTYGVPFDVGVWSVIYYNKDMFREAGLDPESPPVTWDEFLEYGKKMTKGDKYGTAIFVGTGDAVQCMVDSFTFAAGGAIVNDDNTQCLINSEAGIKALDFWKACGEISPPGSVGRSEEDAFKLFTSGQVGMAFYGEWGQDTITTRAPDMDYGVCKLPVPKEGDTSVGTFGGFLVGINTQCKNKDLAFKFIEYTSQKEINKEIIGLTPAHKEAATEFLNEKRVYPEAIYEQLVDAKFRPSIPNYPEIAEIQRVATQKVLLGEADSKTALDEAAAEIDKLLNE